MQVLIIYDSFFGNTEQIARAIGNALTPLEDVGTFRVSDINPEQLKKFKILLVGSPTRGFRPTIAINNLLDNFPINGLNGIKVAAFDTRLSLSDIESHKGRFFVDLGGYAAKPIANQLTKKGGDLIMPPEGFYVKDTEGPLKEGELERAAERARQIIKKL